MANYAFLVLALSFLCSVTYAQNLIDEINNLPVDVLERIYQKLGPKDALVFPSVSRRWREISRLQPDPFAALVQTDPECVFRPLIQSADLEFMNGAFKYYESVKGRDWVLRKMRQACGSEQRPLIYYAAISDNAILLKALFDYGVSDFTDWHPDNYDTVLYRSIDRETRFPRVNALIDNSWILHSTLEQTTSFVAFHALLQSYELQDRLFTLNTMFKHSDSDRPVSLLHLAVIKQDMRFLGLLISKGARLDILDRSHYTPLHLAACDGLPILVEFLLHAGAPVDYAFQLTGRTPLEIALQQARLHPENSLRVVQKLVAAGAKIDRPDKQHGASPLHQAVILGLDDILQFLVHQYTMQSKTLEVKDLHGLTPLHEAAVTNRQRAAEILVGAGADVNSRDEYGRTPLHLAILNYSQNVAVFLVRQCSETDLWARDLNGHSPMDYARRRPVKPQIVALIKGETRRRQAQVLAHSEESFTSKE